MTYIDSGAGQSTRLPNGYQPVDPAVSLDPFTTLAELRRTCPAAQPGLEGLPLLTVLTRCEGVTPTLRYCRTFGSSCFVPSMAAYDAMDDTSRTTIRARPAVAHSRPGVSGRQGQVRPTRGG
jgi:hypothetical protein